MLRTLRETGKKCPLKGTGWGANYKCQVEDAPPPLVIPYFKGCGNVNPTGGKRKVTTLYSKLWFKRFQNVFQRI